MVVFAALFLLAIFLTKNGLPWRNVEVYKGTEGLSYESALVEDLIKRDTDGDGVLDWEESLLGLDPTKTETTAGTPDITVANKLRAEEGTDISTAEGAPEENLTETDKFSRELFSTVAALEQSGSLDETTGQKMVDSLVNSIGNSAQRKIYTLTDLNIDNKATIQQYNNALDEIYTKYPIENGVLVVLEKFIVDQNNVDVGALEELNPIIGQNKKILTALVKTSVPQYLSVLHLNVVNGLQAVTENLSDIQLYDQDAIVALGGMTKYQENAVKLESSLNNLAIAVSGKLSN
ncbi:MAG: hypothetical protein UX71_C0009G0005 [Parcubacteria group bacterium GW2011_GWA1_47_10]|nr:MAG: hypothetical protein UX71_C0009G0005 [Parcubacteria group bacterium GW2011_GWA1_47_10]